MSAVIMDGKASSLSQKEYLKVKSEVFAEKYGRKPCLAVILAGSDPASEVYVRNKIKGCEFVGFKSLSFTLPENVSQRETEELVLSLADDDSVDGILVQLPLPKGLNEKRLLSLIPPEKDVDGSTHYNVGNLMLGEQTVVSCTAFRRSASLAGLRYRNNGQKRRDRRPQQYCG